ncbi:MAG: hypothetical protein QXI64_10755 [Sulfolobales archaeon]
MIKDLLGYRLIDSQYLSASPRRAELFVQGILADHYNELKAYLFEHGFTLLGEFLESDVEKVSSVFSYIALTAALPLRLVKIDKDNIKRFARRATDVYEWLYGTYEKQQHAATHVSVFLRFSLMRVINLLDMLADGKIGPDDIRSMDVYNAFVVGSFLKSVAICDIYEKISNYMGSGGSCLPPDIAILFSYALGEPLTKTIPEIVSVRLVKSDVVLRLYIIDMGVRR